ncbi:hypothetical protein AB0C76_23300 [Kitasatospora sp. NPDC048722]|uniref:hypothetical protein n=1 Tax=Kitasatospora sp. NPDC048722 TaxID=3155639 RepID=UPI00340685D3
MSENSVRTTTVDPPEDGYDVVVIGGGAAAAFALGHELTAEDVERVVARFRVSGEHRASAAALPA